MQRLAHKDLISTGGEDRNTQQQKHKSDEERENKQEPGTRKRLQEENAKPSRAKKNMMKPTAAWAGKSYELGGLQTGKRREEKAVSR